MECNNIFEYIFSFDVQLFFLMTCWSKFSKWNSTDNLFQPLIYFLLKLKLLRQESITGSVITKNKWEILIHKEWKHKTLISLYIQYYNKSISCRLIKHLKLHIHTYVLWNKKHRTILTSDMSTTTERKNISDLSLFSWHMITM